MNPRVWHSLIWTFISTLNAVVSASTSDIQTDSIIISKSLLIPEEANIPVGGFFNPSPSSGDLENSLYNLITNFSDLKTNMPNTSKHFKEIIIDIKSLDSELFQECFKLDSYVSSRGSNPEELEKMYDEFWKRIGVFKYVIFNEFLRTWLEVSSAPSSKKSKQKPNPRMISKLKTSTLENKNIISTLEHQICQRAFTASLKVLNPSQISDLFKNLPLNILDNPEIITAISDFSKFDDISGAALKTLMSTGKYRNHLYFLTPEMVKTLSNTLLFEIIEDRNFDLNQFELHELLTHRPDFNQVEPFVSDHRTFRLFYTDLHLFLVPEADFLVEVINKELKEKKKKKNNSTERESLLSGNVIESILVYFLSSEFSIQAIFEFLSGIWFNSQAYPENNIDFYSNPQVITGLKDLLKCFVERNKLIKAISSIVTDSESSSNLNIIRDLLILLKTPINSIIRQIIRNALNPESSVMNSWNATWNLLFVADPCILSSEIQTIIALIKPEIPYSSSEELLNFNEIFFLWTSICLKKYISEHFIISRWTRNLVYQLLSYPDESEIILSSQLLNFQSKCKCILSLHVNPTELFGISLNRYNWFILPIVEIVSNQSDISTKIRELRKIFWTVNFNSEDVIEAIEKYEIVKNVLIRFTQALSSLHVDALVRSDIGKRLLKENVMFLHRLPTYENFTLNDMKFFNLTLDDYSQNIHTLNTEVAREYLIENEYLVNSATRSLFRPNLSLEKDATFSYNPIVSFEFFFSADEKFKFSKNLEISEYLRGITDHSIEFILGKIAAWLIHMETQYTWMWLIIRIPKLKSNLSSSTYKKVLEDFDKIESKENKKIIKILSELSLRYLEPAIKLKIDNLLSILHNGAISAGKACLKYKDDSNVLILPEFEDRVRADNSFIVSLIQKGSGSEKYKRVWTYRANLLILFEINLKNMRPFEGMETGAHGMIPLNDALLQWVLTNRITIEKIFIKNKIKLDAKQPITYVGNEIPFASMINYLIFN